jgi:hypothetical protein
MLPLPDIALTSGLDIAILGKKAIKAQPVITKPRICRRLNLQERTLRLRLVPKQRKRPLMAAVAQ